MNIPGMEYPRVVNLFGTKDEEGEGGATLIFSRPRRESSARAHMLAPVSKILRLNKRQRSPPSGSCTLRSMFKSWELHRRGIPYAYMFLKVDAAKGMPRRLQMECHVAYKKLWSISD